MSTIEQYDRFEISLEGPSDGNPFVDVSFEADFSLRNRTVTVRGFYDGEGRYLARFMPDEPGEWTWRTRSETVALDGHSGAFSVSGPGDRGRAGAGGTGSAAGGAPNHGPVQVSGTRFAYADGTPYVPIGTTCYAWFHQPKELRDRTIGTLAANAFTKIRMCLFPKHYRYNHNEPELFVFPGSLEDGFDYARFDPAFFADFEVELDRLMQLGIEADLILFHPYDRWGFQNMEAEVEERYLRYAIARLASFRNVWWSMANEWDFMKQKDVQDFHRYFRTVWREDPYDHPRSVHNGHVFYDHALPWVTHCSIQRSNTEAVSEWIDQYRKPVVIDECCYEGDIREGWGNITGRELMRRQWTALVNGGWPGAHGETYYNEEEVLWWSKGGTLSGEAPARIGFMKRILDDAPVAELVSEKPRWDLRRLNANDDYLLYYLGFQRPSWKDLTLPEGRAYEIDVIDTWEMTVTTLDGHFSGEARVPLPAKEYMAIRCRAHG
ncbi:MAG: DUF5605 domain-containing protein [Spirochaetota bacterium]